RVGELVDGSGCGVTDPSGRVGERERGRSEDVRGWPAPKAPLFLRAVGWVGIPAAAYVGSYTGVLLSATNVPLWARTTPTLGPLFFTSALGAGIAGTHLTAKMLGPVSHASEERLHRAEGMTLAA